MSGALNIMWTAEAWDDYVYWQGQDKKTLKRINQLIKDMQRAPFEGIGKPEPLRFEFAGCWSRRITQEHRLVYRVTTRRIDFLQARYHYE